MKFLRCLVLAAALASLAAIVPAAASATELVDSSGMVPPGSTIAAEAEAAVIFTVPFFGNIECGGSIISAKTSTTGGPSETVKANVETLSFTGCNSPVTVLAKGTLEIHTQSGSANGNGVITSTGAELTTVKLGIDCIYKTSNTQIATLTGTTTTGKTATYDIAATVPRSGGSGFCPTTSEWKGSYRVTTPDGLNVDGPLAPVATTLTTSLSGEAKSGEEITVLEGAKVKDQATLSGTNAWKATGKVKYKVYADKECKELVTEAGEVTVSEGKVPASEEKTLEAGRVYYWQASYGGDSSNQASISTCGKEVLTVKAATSLATSLSGEGKEGESITVLEGSKVKDKATLSGTKSSTATGKVKYKVYSDSECKELVTEAGEVTVTAGSVSASEEKTLEAGRVYYWQATYEGDTLHQASTSTCGKEVLTVKAATTLTTSLSGEGKEGESITVLEGSKVKDKATLSGTKSSTATGKVKYKVYSDSECKELVTSAGEVTVTAGSVPASEEKTLSAGAVYYWQASYEGDSLHQASTSTCTEKETVKAATSIATSLSGEGKEGEAITVLEGAKVKDQATLSGTKSSTATGKVKYKVYSDFECKELVTEAGEVTVSEGKVPASEEKTLEAGQIYYWQASYEGDSLHQASTSTCTEKSTVKATTSLETSFSGEKEPGEGVIVDEETAVSDTVTLSGTNAATATGTVEYNVYSDSECKELVASAGKVSVTEGKVPASEGETLPDGTYYWQAVYSGDSTHEGATSVCGNEVELVAEGTSLTTELSTEGESGTEIEVGEETPVTDTATLSGANASEATGSIGYAVYADPECKELVADAGDVTVSEGVAPLSNEVTLPAGTYYWRAFYFGDALNQPSTSACGTEVEVVQPSSLTTSLSGGGEEGAEILVEEETPVMDTATINEENVATATGTVEYNVYSDSECKELVTSAGEVSVSEGKVPASEGETLPDGTYYWQAVYSGDLTHEGKTSVCGTEVEVVAEGTSLTTELSTEGESGTKIEVREEEVVTDTATLSGANASEATGSVAYAVYSDSECKELAVEAGSVSVTEGVVQASEEVMLHAGTYYWQAEYFGDDHNQPSTSACGTEIETVTVAPLTISLAGDGEEAPEIEVDEETPVTATATINEEGAATATGTVKYSVYEDSECKELLTSAGEVSVTAGSVPGSEGETLPEGTYYWQGVYSGDGTHESATSICVAAVQNVDEPFVVSLGDSFISGEGGRWAGNLTEYVVGTPLGGIDPIGNNTYHSLLNEEKKAEAIRWCHRAETAEVFIKVGNLGPKGKAVRGKNLACSGAKTTSAATVADNGVIKEPAFTPGLDFLNEPEKTPIDGGLCALPRCEGQARLLQKFAQDHKGQVEMIAVSIGGNDFGFAKIVQRCIGAFIGKKECNQAEANGFTPEALAAQRQRIEKGLENVGLAMTKGDPKNTDYTILVQDFPSPLPKAGDIRYDRAGRFDPGRCPMGDGDADWANDTAVKKIDETVKAAALNVGKKFHVKFMELEKAYTGRRLCEKGVDLVHVITKGIRSWKEEAAVDKTEWVNQIRIFATLGPQLLPKPLLAHFFLQEDLHPNYWGHLAQRNCLRQAWNDGKPQGGTCSIAGGLARPQVRRFDGWRPEPKMVLK